jgi:hypothetical protein
VLLVLPEGPDRRESSKKPVQGLRVGVDLGTDLIDRPRFGIDHIG